MSVELSTITKTALKPEVQVGPERLLPENGKVNLVGLTREEMKQAFASVGLEPFRVSQVWIWMYKHGRKNFSEMGNIGKRQQAVLAEHFEIGRPSVDQDLLSTDGTRKWLLGFADKNQVEAVFIPDEGRGALCVSSQVGCTLACTFCHTGTMPLVRNLRAHEIIGQVLNARDAMGLWPSITPSPCGRGQGEEAMKLGRQTLIAPHPNPPPQGGREHFLPNHNPFTNIVMMGMGEPLFNYDHIARALQVVMDGDGIAISKRKITLSTSGVVPMMEKCGRELGVNLAVSLHAVTNELRDQIVPLNRKYPIEQLLQACRDYPTASNARRITFEYVMLKGVNDSDAEARALCRLLKDIPAKVNLIPFNPWPGAPYECSSNNRIHAFGRIVNEAGFSSPIRTPRGQDILAACGQLKSESERKKGQKVPLH